MFQNYFQKYRYRGGAGYIFDTYTGGGMWEHSAGEEGLYAGHTLYLLPLHV